MWGGLSGDDGIRIMTVKGLEENGIAFAHEAAPAIVWAVNSGTHIINLSWGRDSDAGNLIYDAIQYAHGQGVVWQSRHFPWLVAAAGNRHDNFPGIISNS